MDALIAFPSSLIEAAVDKTQEHAPNGSFQPPNDFDLLSRNELPESNCSSSPKKNTTAILKSTATSASSSQGKLQCSYPNY